MLLSLIFLIIGSLLGCTMLRFVKSGFSVGEEILWGVPIGIVLLTLLVFAWTFVLDAPVAGIAAGVTGALCMIGAYVSFHQNRRIISTELGESVRSWDIRDALGWLVVSVPWLAYSIYVIPKLLFFSSEGNLVAGWVNVWADWSLHLRMSTFFAQAQHFSLENPLAAGISLRYPPLAAYLSGILQRFGLGPAGSLTLPTFIFFALLPPILYSFGKRITGRRVAGVLFVYIVLLAGGMGILSLFGDLHTGTYFWQASQYAPKLYTDVRQAGMQTNSGIWFMNFIISELLPQRPFLFAIPIALFVLYSLLTATDSRRLLFAGFLFGILPLAHTHSFVALGLAVPCIAVLMLLKNLRSKRERKKILLYSLHILAPAALIGFGILALMVDTHSAGTLIHRINWWVPQQEETTNPFIFWLRNAGPMLMLGCMAWIWIQYESVILSSRSRMSFLSNLFTFITAGLLLFLVANFLSFQSWDFDNLKLLTYWYILWALPVAYFIARLPRFLLPISIIGIILLTGAGLADTLSVAASVAQGGISLADQQGIEFAARVRTATNPDDIILIAPNHDHPISLLSGRKIYLGYPAWLWTYGIDTQQRQQEVSEIYSNAPNTITLLETHHIRYIVLGPQEITKYGPTAERLKKIFPTVVEYGAYRLLKVKN